MLSVTDLSVISCVPKYTYTSKTKEGRKEFFYLTTHSTHFIYGYMASDIWWRTIQIAKEKTRCRHMGYSFRLAARALLYAPSHRQDSTYHGLCYTSHGALAGTRNSSMGPPWRIDPCKTKFDSLQALEHQERYAVHRYRYPKRENIFSIRHLKIFIRRQ